MTLDEARSNIGRLVIYMSRPELPIEQGIIKAVTEEYVFVHYAGDCTSKATRPQDLELAVK